MWNWSGCPGSVDKSVHVRDGLDGNLPYEPNSLSIDFTAPAESRAGAPRSNADACFLVEKAESSCRIRSSLSGNGMGDVFQNFHSSWVPRPNAFDDHWHELYSLCFASLSGLQVGVLVLGVGSGSCGPLLTCLHQGLLPLWGCNSKKSNAAGDPARAGRLKARKPQQMQGKRLKHVEQLTEAPDWHVPVQVMLVAIVRRQGEALSGPQSCVRPSYQTCGGPCTGDQGECTACCGPASQTQRKNAGAGDQPEGPEAHPQHLGGPQLWRLVPRYLVNIFIVTNSPAQEFKIAADFAGTTGSAKKRIRELHVKPSQVDSGNCNKVTLAQVELEAYRSCAVLDKLKSLADGCDSSSQHTIIQVVYCNIQPTLAQVGS
eukprot:s996_g21.t1